MTPSNEDGAGEEEDNPNMVPQVPWSGPPVPPPKPETPRRPSKRKKIMKRKKRTAGTFPIDRHGDSSSDYSEVESLNLSSSSDEARSARPPPKQLSPLIRVPWPYIDKFRWNEPEVPPQRTPPTSPDVGSTGDSDSSEASPGLTPYRKRSRRPAPGGSPVMYDLEFDSKFVKDLYLKYGHDIEQTVKGEMKDVMKVLHLGSATKRLRERKSALAQQNTLRDDGELEATPEMYAGMMQMEAMGRPLVSSPATLPPIISPLRTFYRPDGTVIPLLFEDQLQEGGELVAYVSTVLEHGHLPGAESAGVNDLVNNPEETPNARPHPPLDTSVIAGLQANAFLMETSGQYETTIQLRGTCPPSAFPGYRLFLPNYMEVSSSPSRAMIAAWEAVRPASFHRDNQIIVTPPPVNTPP